MSTNRALQAQEDSIRKASERSQPQLELLMENAFAFNKTGILKIEYPCTADEALFFALGGMIDITVFSSSEDSSVLGYVKALLECGGTRASLSLTRHKAPEIVRSKGWESNKLINSCKIAMSVLYLTETLVPVEKLVSSIIE